MNIMQRKSVEWDCYWSCEAQGGGLQMGGSKFLTMLKKKRVLGHTE
jgi:hypothetical protein